MNESSPSPNHDAMASALQTNDYITSNVNSTFPNLCQFCYRCILVSKQSVGSIQNGNGGKILVPPPNLYTKAHKGMLVFFSLTNKMRPLLRLKAL